MQAALSQENFAQQVWDRYGYGTRMIGLVFARYTNEDVKKIIDSNFDYWDEVSGVDVDFFWAGYGEYYHGRETKTKLKIKVDKNRNSIFYDESAMQSFKKSYPTLKKLKRDRVAVVFVGYENGKPLFDDAICFQFPKSIDKDEYRETMNDLIVLCKDHKGFHDFKVALRKYQVTCKIQNIDIFDIASVVGGIASGVSLFH